MTIFEIICKLFNLTVKAPAEQAIAQMEAKQEEKLGPAERLAKAKKEFAERKEKYLADTKGLFVAQDELHDQISELSKSISYNERRYRDLLGLDAYDKPMLCKRSNEKQIHPADPGYRWEHSNWSDEYWEAKITDDDKLEARNAIETAQGLRLALDNLSGAKEQIDEQVNACRKTIKQMNYVEQMYESKMTVLNAQIKAATTLKSMAKIGTFDVDIDGQLKVIEDQVKHIQWDANASLKVAQLVREGKSNTPAFNQTHNSKVDDLLKLTMC